MKNGPLCIKIRVNFHNIGRESDCRGGGGSRMDEGLDSVFPANPQLNRPLSLDDAYTHRLLDLQQRFEEHLKTNVAAVRNKDSKCTRLETYADRFRTDLETFTADPLAYIDPFSLPIELRSVLGVTSTKSGAEHGSSGSAKRETARQQRILKQLLEAEQMDELAPQEEDIKESGSSAVEDSDAEGSFVEEEENDYANSYFDNGESNGGYDDYNDADDGPVF